MTGADQTLLIVSGTSDSGSALARTVADAGGTVGFTYNSATDAAEELLADLDGDDHEAWQCDVTVPDETASVVSEAFDTLGHVDGLVFTVGVIARSSIEDTKPAEWQRHLDANVTGAFNVIKAAAPEFTAQGDGSIVAVSACDGIMRSPNLAAYDASKQGLIALVQEAARELGPDGVRANVVSPGFIRDPDTLSADARQDLLDQQPYKQLTTPQDIANACLFLCSDRAATTTGAVLPVDSGLSLE
ncbi:SDR family NAD(P)-dependent oxidoreductase [Natrinema gelatinilyticum]|uniref:SDR family NAD(P)-dependent oxidoreductase n=1 Tax=Natrinema gelatinilyticum TaxID=2961571 RepID=UPI0020C2FE54|nr:SDR family oxidoreductase [Natrinema gelatinilyticum]